MNAPRLFNRIIGARDKLVVRLSGIEPKTAEEFVVIRLREVLNWSSDGLVR